MTENIEFYEAHKRVKANTLEQNDLSEVSKTVKLYQELHGVNVNINCIIDEIMKKPMFEHKSRCIVTEAIEMILILPELNKKV